jgi:hypothetical protein
MVKVNRTLALLSLLTLVAASAAIACGGSTEPVQGTQVTNPPVTNPDTGLEVRATIAAASLGRGSANVQIAFLASDATAPAKVAIAQVLLLDASTEATVETLAASSPSIWNGGAYVPWNESVTPGGDLRASYNLTAPKWSDSSSYSARYKLRITLRIDGTEVTIESRELQREPEVVT